CIAPVQRASRRPISCTLEKPAMLQRLGTARLAIALILATLGCQFSISMAAAQSASPLVLRVDPLSSPLAGNVTFTGVAVDCGTVQAATEVELYDGPNTGGVYLADASVSVVRSLGGSCPGLASNLGVGFSLNLDTHRLVD